MTQSTRLAALGIACLSLVLPGCGLDQHPAYSGAVKYGVRLDPVFTGTGKELGEERYDLDRPGVLPLMAVKDVDKPDHPYHAKRANIVGKVLRDPSTLSSKDRQDLEAALEKLFGTPAMPTVNAKEAGFDAKVIADLQLDDQTLAEGSKRYRVHCLHCHGVTGDGRGPTGRWINPHPRDFRPAIFKFQSVDQSKGFVDLPPRRADLERTLRQGIEGTAMPTFNLLKDKEIEQLVSYVIHLSLRGQVEFTLLKEVFAHENGVLAWKQKDPILEEAKFYLKKFATENWLASHNPANAIQVAKYTLDPKDLQASIKRGKEIFAANPSDEFKKAHALRTASAAKKAAKAAAALAKKKKDAKTKNPDLTDDEVESITLDNMELAALAFDDAERKELETAASDAEAMKRAENFLKGANCVSCHNNYGRQALYRFDGWGTLVRPNNVTLGNFRGGKRPVDIYYRIHSGINGSGMTPFGTTFRGHEDYIWDLVNFVKNVPYPAMRQGLGID